ncbi:MAG TPA: tellurite resistance TerB family protein [Azospirillaceae bacterium]|nr:tellurite resistance TerB family protein [Azospirillaceae bacterium]
MGAFDSVLGGLLASGMGGRSARGPAFAASAMAPAAMSRGGFKQTAGMAALGYLAYKAYQDMKARDPASVQAPTVHLQGRSATGDGPSLGDRLGDLLSRGPAPEMPSASLGDEKAMLLIRAMVAAANADGVISPQERQAILSKLDAAGAGPEERRAVERELADPPSIDDIVRQVNDPEMAEQVYIASEVAVGADSPAGESYLRYLADRLHLTPEQIIDLRVA